jgi:hypothetical protein
MISAERLKQGLILTLLVIYATTTPILAASHVHVPAAGSHRSTVASMPHESGPTHGTFCEICYRVTNSSLSSVSIHIIGFQLPSLAFRTPEEPWLILASELSSLPPRAPPASPRS